MARLRRRLANGYRNRKFGTRDYPDSALGALVLPLVPTQRAIVDAGMRHLPPLPEGGRLLDLGCGNGSFLLRARSAGWQTLGVDLDSKAINAAEKLGLDARLGGVETLDPDTEQFDVITMSHVIEHVHDPVEVLTACAALLRRGGLLWLETPNICSAGHSEFGRHWRGLEPPRHLVIFSPEAMTQALEAAGFSDIRVQPYRRLCRETFAASAAIAAGIDPYSGTRPAVPAGLVAKAERLARADQKRREFITLQARK
jgi:2-polyprenyl-3-methyl-5-hydroxy-6-metoxy-1,4-benzoquinol methylase